MPKEDPEQILRVLKRQRLNSLIQTARQQMRSANLSGEELMKLQSQILQWNKELQQP
jgi:hypothetical protein